MKKRTKIILIVIASIILLGIIFGIIDYNRIKSNQMPLFMIRITDGRKTKLNYIGLGYRLQRQVGVSHKESLISDNYVKFGTWFYIKDIEIKSNKSNNDYQENIESNQSENSISCKTKDFEMTLSTDKKEYKTTDKIIAWATFKYIGNNDNIKIWHASEYMTFTITDGKDFNVEGLVNYILLSTTLEKDKLYHFDYVKSGGFDASGPDAKFWEKFYQEKDLYLPSDEYTIAANANFSYSFNMNKNEQLTCKLKIKVVD